MFGDKLSLYTGTLGVADTAGCGGADVGVEVCVVGDVWRGVGDWLVAARKFAFVGVVWKSERMAGEAGDAGISGEGRARDSATGSSSFDPREC